MTDENGVNSNQIEAALDAALTRLPRHAASEALRRRIRQQVVAPGGRRPSPAWLPSVVSAFAAAALVALVVRFVPAVRPDGETMTAGAAMVTEAVNDHIRVVSSSRPVEIESGGIHQVKPWFTGRLDFAPRISFSGDDEFPLVGGSVGYFRDRKAAVFLFRRHLHLISLLIFAADGLPWPSDGRRSGGTSARERTAVPRLFGAAVAGPGARVRAGIRRQPPGSGAIGGADQSLTPVCLISSCASAPVISAGNRSRALFVDASRGDR